MDDDLEIEREIDPRADGPAAWDLDASPVGRALMPAAPPPADGVDWAELPLRAGALLIDLAIVSVLTDLIGRAINWAWISWVFPTLTMPYTPVETSARLWQSAVLIGPTILMWVLIGAGAVYLWSVYRATPGQMALGLFTVDTAGRPLRRGPAAVRFGVLAIGWILTGATNILVQITQLFTYDGMSFDGSDVLQAAFAILPLVWFAILSLTMLRDPRGRGWQDKAAGSVVVRRSGPPS